MSSPCTKLSVNINAVAYLRNRRDVPWPSLLDVSRAILDAGADGITVHPRPDQRHVRFTDVLDHSALLRSEYPEAEFNIEGYPTDAFIDLVLAANPDQVTLVPDTPEQSTSDHGWDFAQTSDMLTEVINVLKGAGLRVSLFVDANTSDPISASAVGADRIEFYTGPYANQVEPSQIDAELNKLHEAANVARDTALNGVPLVMNAGHDLTTENIPALLKAVPDLAEVSIGHGITADALMMGFPAAVKRYLQALGHKVE
jgi:pyridoxine 5-phosphate synthase